MERNFILSNVLCPVRLRPQLVNLTQMATATPPPRNHPPPHTHTALITGLRHGQSGGSQQYGCPPGGDVAIARHLTIPRMPQAGLANAESIAAYYVGRPPCGPAGDA